jgi:hypothetical protein
LKIGVICLQIVRAGLRELPRLGGLQRDLQRLRNMLGNVALDDEHVVEGAIIVLRPEVALACHID